MAEETQQSIKEGQSRFAVPEGAVLTLLGPLMVRQGIDHGGVGLRRLLDLALAAPRQEILERLVAEAAGEILLLIPNLSVLGFLELSLGRPAEADAHLSRAVELEQAMGVREPAYFRLVPDEVEALVALGRLDEAEALLAPFEESAGTIVGFTYGGSVATELESGQLGASEALDLLDDLLAIRELEEMIVRLRSGGPPMARHAYKLLGVADPEPREQVGFVGREVRAVVALTLIAIALIDGVLQPEPDLSPCCKPACASVRPSSAVSTRHRG